jgi:phosphomethylpyrimidine synthase
MAEIAVIGGLVRRSLDAGVRVIVEGPGHVPLNDVAAQVIAIKRACHGVPLYVLGPLVTDIAPGYDHITSAVGGTLAPRPAPLPLLRDSANTRLPNLDDVRTARHAECARGDAEHLQRATGTTRWRAKALDGREVQLATDSPADAE